jgi:hypothetical protein
MARKPTPPKPLREWRIILIRSTGHLLGRVDAPDTASADGLSAAKPIG